MLQSRLTGVATLTAIAAVLFSACGGGGALEDNVVRPGITAMDESQALACGTDRATLQTAIEAYSLLVGNPPPDEAALVTEQFLREPSELWSVVNGQLVAQHPDCGAVPTGTMPPVMTAPATTLGEIVTDTGAPLTPDEMLATFTDEQIASVGGIECATELGALFAAAERYVSEQGTEPTELDELVSAGYLTEPIALWVVENDVLTPAPGSPCVDPSAVDPAESCSGRIATLEVARHAYHARFGDDHEPNDADLVEAGFIREDSPDLEMVNGTVVPTPGGPCDTTGG